MVGIKRYKSKCYRTGNTFPGSIFYAHRVWSQSYSIPYKVGTGFLLTNFSSAKRIGEVKTL